LRHSSMYHKQQRIACLCICALAHIALAHWPMHCYSMHYKQLSQDSATMSADCCAANPSSVSML
jgi:DNA-binding transcriptional regulator of glucitol operon